MKPSPKQIDELLTRGVAEVIDREHLKARLLKGEKLRLKLGIDPTGPILHLGHSVPLRLLRRFQNLGHTVIFLVGDFTASIGDPSGRKESRPPLTGKEIKKNMKTYLQQAGMILDIKRVEVRYNNEWFGKMSLTEMFKLFGGVTYGQVSARRDFQERIQAHDENFTISEFSYPIYQGYDSVALKADVEVGGTDQKFNMLMGRRIQRRYSMPEQDVITVPLLEGLDGVNKMSKSEDNYIGLMEAADEVYGKIMTVPDALMARYFEFCTDVDLDEIKKILKGNPRDAKMRLAREVVALYHGAAAARKAEEQFVRTFQKHETPDHVSHITYHVSQMSIVELLVKTKLAASKSEARRVVEQGGVKVDGKVIDNPDATIKLTKQGVLLQRGKRHFVRVTT